MCDNVSLGLVINQLRVQTGKQILHALRDEVHEIRKEMTHYVGSLTLIIHNFPAS